MDELTMLVQLAGGEQEVANRLRSAGFRRARDLARASASDISGRGGLSEAAARRLIRAAQEVMSPAEERKTKSPRSGLRGFPAPPEPAVGPPIQEVHVETVPSHAPAGEEVPVETVGVEPADEPLPEGYGVSRLETTALTGEPAREDRPSPSFWRFG